MSGCQVRVGTGRARWAIIIATAALASFAGAQVQVARAATAAWPLADSQGQIASPTGVAAGPHGRMWYSTVHLNTLNSADGIASVDLGGHFKIYRTPGSTNSIAALPSGVVYATEGVISRPNRLIRLSPRGAASEVPLPTAAAAATGIISGPDGDGWFVENSSDGTINNVGRVTPAGKISEFAVPALPEADGSTTPASPSAITPGPGATLWVGVAEGVDVMSAGGTILRTIRFPLTYGSPSGIAVAGDGSAWVTSSQQFLIEISPAGTVSQVPLPTYSQADSIARGPDGNIYFMGAAGSGVWRATGPGAPVAIPFTVDVFQGESWATNDVIETGQNALAPGPAGTLWLSAELDDIHGGSTDEPVTIDLAGRCIVPQLVRVNAEGSPA